MDRLTTARALLICTTAHHGWGGNRRVGRVEMGVSVARK